MELSSKISKWEKDPVSFIEEAYNIKLYWYQKLLLKGLLKDEISARSYRKLSCRY